MNQDKPLTGIKVVDFSAVFAGPICARLMSDCGADVIKVEPPRGGDVVRGPKGTSRVFEHFNAGKRGVAINLNHADGQRAARALLHDADVLIENYRPGIMARFGLDYESLKDEFPQLVYCSISGFGQGGPYVDRAAYAPIAHAASGFYSVLMSAQNDWERPPVSNIMIADMLTGSYAHGAVLTALMGRHNTGRGDHIDVTMLESMMMLMPNQLQMAQLDYPVRPGGFHPVRCSDGFVMICIVSEKNMRCLADAMGKPELMTDERFTIGQRPKHMEAFIEEVERFTMQYDGLTCESLLNEAGVPCSVYNQPSDLFSHPQLTSRDSFTELNDKDGAFLIPRAPYLFASSETKPEGSAPGLGEHTASVLADHFDDATLTAMRNDGAIA